MTEHRDGTTSPEPSESSEAADEPVAGSEPSQSSPAVVGPTGPVGRATEASFSGTSAAPVAFPDPSHSLDLRPAGSAVSASSALRPVPEETESGTLMSTLGMEVLVRGSQRTVVRMPVDGARQVAGFLHGGATAALVETAASVAARAAAPEESLPVGAELTVSHLRPVKEGWVTAEAIPLHLGRRTAVYEVSIKDDDGAQVARGSLRSLFT